MKKTLIAVAALSAMAASAMAANVTVSGVMDLGLSFQNVKKSGFTDSTVKNGTVRTFKLDPGLNSGSRVALKGSEEIGDNLVVGFHLENGFTGDDGKLGQGNRFFGRESRLYVKTAFGTIHAGRFGALDSGTGSVSIFGAGDLCAFGTVAGESIMKESTIFEGLTDRYDNSIAYQSPTFAGATLYVAHSFKLDNVNDEAGVEGRPTADQYNGVGLKYANGPFNAAFVASQKNYKNTSANVKNSKAFSLGAAYDFGVCKLMAEGQYFNMGRTNDALNKGWGTIVSVTAPVAGGTILASAGYKDAENIDVSTTKEKVMAFGLGYTYSLSKRTMLYAEAGYSETKGEKLDAADTKTKTTNVIAGLVHKF